jgi:hemolysin D
MSRSAETAFLPAALEIQENPPSPAGRMILWTILAFFVLAIAWASLGEVDIVSVAQGRIIPSGHSKTVQPLEIGTVTAIHVADGQAVRAGEVLIELDPSSVQADVDRLRAEQDRVQREILRHRQLADWLGKETPPNDQQLQAVDDRLLHRQWLEFSDRIAVLKREQDQQHAERQSAQHQVDKLEAVLPIVTRKAKDQQGLAKKKLLSEQQYLETEQDRREIFHDLRTHKGKVVELDAAEQALDARIAYTRSEFHRQVLEGLEEAQRRQSMTRQELIKAETRIRAQTITAPVDGVVQQLAIHSVGAIVTPAQALMVIVPAGGALEVEAVLENKDIGFVEVGQEAEIKIDTFPFTKYGTIVGRVVDLSDDAVADEQKGLVYKMRVLMQESTIHVNGKQVALNPGMTVTVESKTGTRKMIEFFLSPLLRYRDESVRER